MSIRLRAMTQPEYDAFYEYSRNRHADELIRELGLSYEESLRAAQEELRGMLPDGRDTRDNYLMVIEAAPDGRFVGFIWFLYEMTDGIRQVFVCDLVLRESERNKGYASAALAEMEWFAIAGGCAESVLFVADDNLPARKLYDKCGYSFLKSAGYGKYLKKAL